MTLTVKNFYLPARNFLKYLIWNPYPQPTVRAPPVLRERTLPLVLQCTLDICLSSQGHSGPMSFLWWLSDLSDSFFVVIRRRLTGVMRSLAPGKPTKPQTPDSQLTEFKCFKCYIISARLIVPKLTTDGYMVPPCGSTQYNPQKVQTL